MQQTFGQGNFGGGAVDTMIHPLVAVVVLIAVVMLLSVRRQLMAAPFLLGIYLTPVGQQLYLGGVHLYVPRLLIAAVLIRACIQRLPLGPLNNLDKPVLLWVALRVSAVCLLYLTSAALINQIGFVWDTAGGYLALRVLIRDEEDIAMVVRSLAVVTAVLGLTMVAEVIRDQNVFGYIGGTLTPAMREGKIRAQGTFEHAILAGSFGATSVPMFLWLAKRGGSVAWSLAGLTGATCMVWSSASSTPLMAYLAVILGLCFWPLRRSMQTVRRGLVLLLIACHLMMKAPVWFLLAHVDLIAGNSGYHRALLIDTFINHFREWWLFGTNQASTWGYEADDLCNQWVAEGETGGLATLVVFILTVSRCFRSIGTMRRLAARHHRREWMMWMLGVALFAHVVAYFGISYFDRTQFLWFALIASISALSSQPAGLTREESERAAEAVPDDTWHPSLAGARGVF